MEIDENPSTPEHNLSLVAGNIVSNAVQATRHLFCPFCADFFLFEFTLKDHLKKAHTKELRKQHTKDVNFETANDSLLIDEDDAKENCSCKFCGAIFKYAGLLPKHIADHHDPMCLNLWQQQNERDGDLPFGSRTSDPTMYVALFLLLLVCFFNSKTYMVYLYFLIYLHLPIACMHVVHLA